LPIIGRQQVEAVEKQNFQLRVSERRRLARDGLVAARLFDGIILNVARDIEAIDTFGNDPNNTVGDSETNRIRQKLKAPPLYEIIEQLGKLNREAIGNYFLLCSSIDSFRIKTAAENAAALKTELNGIRNLVSFLRKEVAGDAKKADDVLFETQGSVSNA
jgi:hypothetical protein